MLQLVRENDPILKQTAPIFDFDNADIVPALLSEQMHEAMRHHGGVGLAAPQVGLLLRVFVMDVQGITRTCFNPKVMAFSSTAEKAEEGCLSFPNLWLSVSRSRTIDVEYQNIFGNLVNETFEGLAARCYSHETDHLNGIRFIDLVSPFAREQAKNKRRKGK